MNSRTYQLSAVPNDDEPDDETNFSHALVRPLQAEQLLDAIAPGDGRAGRSSTAIPAGTRAGQLPGVPVAAPRARRRGDGAVPGVFGKPERLLSCDCERSDDTTLAQALQLITGDIVNEASTQPDNRLGRLLKAGRSNEEIVEELYLAACAGRRRAGSGRPLLGARRAAPGPAGGAGRCAVGAAERQGIPAASDSGEVSDACDYCCDGAGGTVHADATAC